jgi:L-ascorbate metabolism protein UlaG (beta-lactamase superfamily)
LVTHGHFDHIINIPDIINKTGRETKIYCTAKPEETLILKGVAKDRIHKITPGDVINIGPFTIRVLKGKHIVFNLAIILKTIFNRRVFSFFENLKFILKENRNCTEAGETVVYDITASGKHILLLGSLNLDKNTEYPEGSDLLILPLQGRSDLDKYAVKIIERLKPKKILLDHFDDSFPPISSFVDPHVFMERVKQKHPDISVICPQAGAEWITV